MKSNGVKSNMRAMMLIPSELLGCMRRRGWRKLTVKAVVELAAPQTWSASILPVVLASALAIAMEGRFHFGLFFSILATSILLQCAVNTLNDYSDFMTGVDTRENCDDPTDASLVYHDYEPVLAFAIGALFILAALCAGLYAIILAGPLLILFGFIGAVVIFCYSYGLIPISYTASGEFFSGFVMGGIITFATYYAFTGHLSWQAALYSVPLIITIGLIMLTNNSCDIEKDAAAGRHTLPGRIGRARARRLHVVLFAIAAAFAGLVVALRFPGGAWMLPLFALFTIPVEHRQIAKTGLLPENRVQAMMATTTTNVRLAGMYALMIGFSRLDLLPSPEFAYL